MTTETLTIILANGTVLGAIAGVIGYLIAKSSLLDAPRIRLGENLHQLRIDVPDDFGQIVRIVFDEPHSARHKWLWLLVTCETCVAWEAAVVATIVWAAVTGTGWVSFGVLAVAMAVGRVVAR